MTDRTPKYAVNFELTPRNQNHHFILFFSLGLQYLTLKVPLVFFQSQCRVLVRKKDGVDDQDLAFCVWKKLRFQKYDGWIFSSFSFSAYIMHLTIQTTLPFVSLDLCLSHTGQTPTNQQHQRLSSIERCSSNNSRSTRNGQTRIRRP